MPGGVVFRPCPSFQIWNAGWDAGGFNVVAACCEVVLNEMNLGLDNGEFIVEVSESVVSAPVSLNFSGRIPVIEVSNGTTKSVVGGSGAVEECVEPNGEWLGNVGR
jgi:hypothetical protein